ncbi:MAG: amidohydrolase family protein [Rhodobacteraceae bacterium]|nr:amidohydrolase family protein [Paracoccaceae bacterium]
MTAPHYPGWVRGMEVREDWLALVSEPILDPDREIVDPHHHLWDRNGGRYELDALWRDTGSGHNVLQTVFIECRSYYETDGPQNMRPVGETAQVARIAAQAAARPDRAQIAGIVAHADLRDPDLDRVLDAHEKAGNGLLRGIRHAGACDSDPAALTIPGRGTPGLYADPDFRSGLARLGARGLTYDTWQYHHQIDALADLARAVPDTVIVIDHFSTPLGVGRFTGQRDTLFAQWQRDMEGLARCANLRAKLGGLAMPDNGWSYHTRDRPPGSDEIAETHGKWYRHMLDCFGPYRCMFESNFPVDRVSLSYPVIWNAFKKIADPLDEDAKTALFCSTARDTYRL